MNSIKNDQFNQPLAENQEEYNTLHINLNTEDPYCPATVFFQFSPEELSILNANEGKFYYQQCLFRTEERIEMEGTPEEVVVYVPANQFHPMSIQVTNPLDK